MPKTVSFNQILLVKFSFIFFFYISESSQKSISYEKVLMLFEANTLSFSNSSKKFFPCFFCFAQPKNCRVGLILNKILKYLLVLKM